MTPLTFWNSPSCAVFEMFRCCKVSRKAICAVWSPARANFSCKRALRPPHEFERVGRFVHKLSPLIFAKSLHSARDSLVRVHSQMNGKSFRLELRNEKKRVFVDMVTFNSLAQKAGIDFDWEILSLQIPTDRPAKQWMYFPALALLGLLVIRQRRRRI